MQESAYPYVSGATGLSYSCDDASTTNPLVVVTGYHQYVGSLFMFVPVEGLYK